jgi:CRP-like cAMP-binding protein
MPHHKLIARLLAIGDLTEDSIAKLVRMPHVIRKLGHGDLISHIDRKPACCTVVMSGMLARQELVGERNQISSFYVPGDIPDLQTLQLPHVEHELCSIGSSTIASVPHSHFRLMMESGELTQAFWRETLLQGEIYREWVDNLGSRNAMERVAHLLCELATRLELVGLMEECDQFRLPLRQQNVADAVGLSTVHVNRTLQELRRASLIEWRGETIRLLERAKLEDISDFNADYLRAIGTARNAARPTAREEANLLLGTPRTGVT